MKPIVISTCLVLAVLPLFGAAPQTSTDPSAASTHVQKLYSSPQNAGFGDSPLVRAAKATNRIGKRPTAVITNESLIREGGHFTTTTAAAQVPLPTPPRVATPNPDEVAAKTRRDRLAKIAAADKARKLEQQKKDAQARAAAREEGDTAESIYADAPASAGPIGVMKPSTPATMGQEQPPQSQPQPPESQPQPQPQPYPQPKPPL
jgi:hypothetical protein